ncbi:MAG: NADH-quinone oxidoreductase subunit L [candidate division Zixibacteria bacterium HGW-Zixibacteria-1]|nr:MAG: NADH-quinone oxidoreductase subunit L [candidate division Zixibacteria bacterium HGW-Zixibacteria-1]
MEQPLYLIPLIPLIGFLLNGLLLGRLGKKMISLIACGSVGLSFLLGLKFFFDLLSLPETARVIENIFFTWIPAGQLHVNVAFMLDPLSAIMVLVVSGVGFLIHVYSIGYMSHDPGYGRYFTYLNLFIFSMLMLVLADNYLLMFVGWEGVGLCSYLLIGFWFEKKSATDAGKKAFIVNRIGDFGFLLGMFIIFWQTGSLDFKTALDPAVAHSVFITGGGLITAATLLLFLGATGKSAQIPLYVWLPDAMEGPTPVSALIHAATMVTAGVYMIARSNVLYMMAPATLTVVAIVGVATAIFAGTIALAQNDIKRVLAYSTVSQLGYMFTACGVAAFGAGIFHLMTHAFFKALLFLGSGSVIHAMSGQQDMRFMGGLKKRMPVTFWTFLIATLAIAGIPGLSGFFSKDEILWKAFSSDHGSIWIWLIGLLTAGLTAFYMFRLVFLTFFGQERMDSHTKEHLHESPKVMTVPLSILAILSIIGGYVGIPHLLGGGNRFEKFLEPVMKGLPHSGEGEHTLASAGNNATTELVLMAGSVVLVLIFIYLAYHFYIKNIAAAGKLKNSLSGIHKLLYGKYFIDELYDVIIVTPLVVGSKFLWKIFDVLIIDGFINGMAVVIGDISTSLRPAQSGVLRTYTTIFLVGVVVILGLVIIFN